MKKNKLIIIIVLIILFIGISIFALTRFNVQTHSINEKVDVGCITIKDGKLDYENNLSTFTANAIANSDCEFKYVEIIVQQGKEKYTLKGYVGKEIKKGQSVILSSSIDQKIDETSKVSYKLVK